MSGTLVEPAPALARAAAPAYWQGRIALQSLAPSSEVEASLPGQRPGSYSASFELQGNPEQGELRLFSPLGTELARLQWGPQGAQLITPGSNAPPLAMVSSASNGSLHTSPPPPAPTLSQLLRQHLGTDIPIQALFDWLRGHPTPTPGWSPDLSQHAQGRISARCEQPEPGWQLRVILQKD